jgi:hypothetical protein
MPLTPAVALERMSEATGINLWALDRLARALREAPGDLWPKSGRGGGKAARHVEAHHLVNLILALAAEPSEAVAAVTTLRDLRFQPKRVLRNALLGLSDGTGGSSGQSSTTPPDVQALSLGQRLQLFVSTVAHHQTKGRSDVLDEMRSRFVSCTLAPTTPAAWFFWSKGDGTFANEDYLPAQGLLGIAPPAQGRPRAVLRRSTSFDFALIETAAELLADTMARRGGALPPSPSGEASGNADPENENAAPGRTASRDQDCNSNSPGTTTDTPEVRGECESTQAPSSRGSGPSPIDEGSSTHAHRTPDPSSAAAA